MIPRMRSLPVAAALAVLAFGALSVPAAAQGGRVSPQIAVPSPGGGGGGGGFGYQGCYSLNGPIYGPYYVNFCLQAWGGSYTVNGGGLNCRGGLNWSRTGDGVHINLQRSECGAGTAWTADSLSCRSEGGNFPFPNPFAGGKNQPRIAVPSPNLPVPIPLPCGSTLRCTYIPTVAGYQPVSVQARRTN